MSGTNDEVAGIDATVRATPSSKAASDDLPALPAIDPSHYALGDEIARGGMGRILAARDRRLGRTVAIKELLHGDAEARARFEREARITARLQHPAIVNVIEAGSWPSGEPFFVMKLVTGESLDKVIARRDTLAARIGLVPEIIAVTRAIAYAHGKRVIHRDLKPQNVLVGEFGEIVVVDWGLAKDLDSNEPSLQPSTTPKKRSAPDETVAGSVMGTPAYMPSEQALGDPVDERADVYALGAMLYHVLAGKPPYTGATTVDILADVIKGPPIPVAKRAPGAPPDLVAIVTRAMAHDAKDRYPTAKELAEDLEKFQTGQLVGVYRYSAWQLIARWIKKHRAAVTIAALAVIALAVVGVIAIRRIVEERSRAERQRAEAEALVEVMMIDARDKLAPLGRVELLEAMAKNAREYYAKYGAANADRERRAKARFNLGTILQASGDLPGALVEYRAALDSDHPEHALDKVGDVLLAQRDLPGALEHYRKSMALAITPHDIAVSHDKIGDALAARADLDGALAEFEQAKRLRLASADDPQKMGDLVAIYERIGDIHESKKAIDLALVYFTMAQSITLQQASLDRDDDSLRRDLAASYDHIGDLLVDKDAFDVAMSNYVQSLALRQRLAQKDPANTEYQRLLSLSLDDVADIHEEQHRPLEARELYERSTTIAATLAARDPSNVVWQRDLAWSHSHVADTYVDTGEREEARRRYQTAIDILEALARRVPDDPLTQRALAKIRAKLQ